MDKRNFLFFITVMLSVFLVQVFFGYRDQQRKAAYAEELAAWKAQRRSVLLEEMQDRAVTTGDLPLIALRSSSEASPIWGIQVEDHIFTLAKNGPETLFAEGDTETVWTLSQAGQGVSVYSRDLAAPLKTAGWPHAETQAIHLVQLMQESPSVIFAAIDHGHFTPLGETPKDDAIAVVRVKDGYLPIAIYNAENQTLNQLELLGNTSISPSFSPLTFEEEETAASEQFFVLENSVQQLVFSSRGGALVELNLPFQDDAHPGSFVREIGFDKDIVEGTAHNAYFPSQPYYTPGTKSEGPHLLNDSGSLGGYYPLLRREIRLHSQGERVQIPAAYYALNVVSLKYPEIAELTYQVKEFTAKRITFEAIQRHRRITKTFTLSDDPQQPYIIDLTVKIDNDSRELWLTSGVPEVEIISNASNPALKYHATRKQKREVDSLSLPKEDKTLSDLYPDWICNSNGFFGLIIDPLGSPPSSFRSQLVPGQKVPSRLLALNPERFKADKLPGYQMLSLLPNKPGTFTFRIYAGPFASAPLSAVDHHFTDSSTGLSPNYSAAQSFHGWFRFISEPFAKFLFFLIQLFHRVTDSWAISIVLLTIALRLMLYPLNSWSMKSMKRMQQIQPEITALQAKYKKDPKRAQMEVMQLYREKGVNPFSGCFPLLIQLPFLIGMFDLLKSTFELRGAPFIPGWIDDLAAPDVLFTWHTHIFFIGTEFHLLPLLLGGVMWLQSRMSSTAPKGQPLTEQQKQQKMMSNMMMVMFTVMFYNFPSGLNIYWLSSMLLGILQQWWVNQSLEKMPQAASAKA